LHVNALIASGSGSGVADVLLDLAEWTIFGMQANALYLQNSAYLWNNNNSYLANADNYTIQQFLNYIHNNNLSIHFVFR